MAYQESTGFCKICNKQSMLRRKGINHIFHFFMSVVTLGLWIIVWIASAIRIGGWRCTQCGSKVSRDILK